MLSKNVKAKAILMVKAQRVITLDDKLFQVMSSTKDDSYIIDMNDPNHHKKECWGMRLNNDCSHLEAIRIFEKEQEHA